MLTWGKWHAIRENLRRRTSLLKTKPFLRKGLSFDRRPRGFKETGFDLRRSLFWLELGSEGLNERNLIVKEFAVPQRKQLALKESSSPSQAGLQSWRLEA